MEAFHGYLKDLRSLSLLFTLHETLWFPSSRKVAALCLSKLV